MVHPGNRLPIALDDVRLWRASSTDSINPSGGYRLSTGALHHTPNVMALTGNAANGADMKRHHVDGLQATLLLYIDPYAVILVSILESYNEHSPTRFWY